MPRLAKIRLTGCRYDGMQKEHENSIFDLTKDDQAYHSLFTLANGCGKGLMMQLIFQILLPKTRWGTNNGNKVISMFYDRRNNLHPFTFHVALEWILDTVPEKRLITGIAVKAIMKNASSEDEEKTGLSYFLYTHEHEGSSPFTIENLPLYDKKTKEGVDLDIIEDFINSNKRDFIKYSKTSAIRKDSEYYNFLESRGIYRSEWLNLKEINKLEGGVGDYFAGAGDNKSIFDKIIIPGIGENIKNYSYEDRDNLIEMFRSNLSITKDLPILLKREGDYKELLSAIEPLIINADKGSRYNDIKERLINEGNDIAFILNDENIFNDKEIEKWELEDKKAKEEKEQLEYKKDNLYYNQQRRELESKEKQAKDLDVKLKQKTQELDAKIEEQTSYEVNRALYNRKNIEDEIRSKSIEKEKLIESLDISDIKQRGEYLDGEIEIEWDKTKDRWIHIETQYSAYMNYSDGIKKENNAKKKQYIEKNESLQLEVSKFELKEEDLSKKKTKLEEVYDSLSLAFPERILGDLNKTQEETKEKISSLNDEIINWNKIINKIDMDKVKLDYEIAAKEKDIESLNKEINQQSKIELELSKKIAKELIEAQEGGLLTHNWFDNKLDKLEDLKGEKSIKLDSLKRAIWERSIDKILNREDYFIPNKDILLIKEEINKLGIQVQTGSEYLKQVDEKESLKLLSTNPGFLYSVVIGSQKDWEIINKNISPDLFINNMVPIYIRSKMNSTNGQGFEILESKADRLVHEEAYRTWKSQMQIDIEKLTDTQQNIKEDLSNIDRIIGEINIINTKDTSLILKQKIDKTTKEISEILEKNRSIEEEKLDVIIKINNNNGKLKQINQGLEDLNRTGKQIEEYIEVSGELQIENVKIKAIKKQISELKEDIKILDEDNEEIGYNQESTRDSYYPWKSRVEKIIEDVKQVYKDAEYAYQADKDYSNYKIPGFNIEAHKLNVLIGERKVIEEDITVKNTDIAVLDTEIKGLDRDRSRYIKELEGLSKSWTGYDYLDLTLNRIEIIVAELKRTIKIMEKENIKIKSELDINNGNMQYMKKESLIIQEGILKTHSRVPRVLDLEDIEDEMDIVKRDIASNIDFLKSCREILEENKDIKNKFEINLSKIKTGYPLEINKGKTNKILKSKLRENPDSIIEDWLRHCQNNKSNIDKIGDEGESLINRFIKDVGDKLEEDRLREKIISAVKDTNINNFTNNLLSFKSMKENFQSELLRLSNDKVKAEESMKQWTDRASMHVIKMIDALKSMVASMNYINEEGHAFPLVKLKGIERLPKEKSEISYLLDEYFIQAVSEVLEQDIDIYNIEDKKLKELMGDKVIFSKALQGRYPTLLVYKMSEKNEFRYARARDEYYTTWEAINKGEGDRPEGSGGQTLSVNTFVIMMIMSFKKKHIGNEAPSTVLILDNPFGKASDKHVVDPIFEIADKLNFQLICFSPPGIIKVEISERFPVFLELKIEDGKVIHGGRVMKKELV